MTAVGRTNAARCRLVAVGLLCAVAFARADDPKAKKPVEPLKLPPGTVILVTDDPKEALSHPDAVVLSAAEYRKLVEAAERAVKPADKPDTPSVCRLSGRIQGDVARLTVIYQLRTTQPKQTVPIGGQKGFPVECRLDGAAAPVLVPVKEDGGFAALIDVTGEHRLEVEYDVPLGSRANKPGERGFEFGLPGAAITAVERFELPEGIARARLGTRPIPAKLLAEGGAVLGPAKLLELYWEPPSAADAQTVADSRVDVRVEEREATVKQRLTLKAPRAAAGEWRVNTTVTAEVTLAAPIPAGAKVERTGDKKPTWVVRRELGSDDVTLDISARVTLVKTRPALIPLASVAGAVQRGSVNVLTTPGLRALVQGRGDFSRRDSDEGGQLWAFGNLASGTALEITDVQPVRGEVEGQVYHTLALGERGWRWAGRVELKPIRQELDRFEIDAPAELAELRSGSPELVESLGPPRDGPGGRKLWAVRLADSRRKPFAVLLEGLYPQLGPAQATAFDLPRLRDAVDRGGSVLLMAPPGMEVRAAVREWEGDRPGTWERPAEPVARGGGWLATTERAAARVELAWRNPQADRPAITTVDATVERRQIAVRQTWRVPLTPLAGRAVLVKLPAATGVRLLDGGTLAPGAPGEATVLLPPGATGEAAVAFGFTVPLPTTEGPVTLPLVTLAAAPNAESELRVWVGDGGAWPSLSAAGWSETPAAPVAGRAEWPALTARATGVPALTLALREAAPVADGQIERTWVQVLAGDDGWQWRTRFRVRPGPSKRLTLEWPTSAVPVGLVAVWDGRRVPGRPVERGGDAVLAFRLEPPASGVGTLDLFYRSGRPGDVWGWRADRLTPPRPLDAAMAGPARWQLAAPGGGQLLPGESALVAAERLTVAGGLLDLPAAWDSGEVGAWFAPDAPSEPAFDAGLTGTLPAGLALPMLIAPRGHLSGLVSLLLLGAVAVWMKLPVTRRRIALLLVLALTALMIALGWGALLERLVLAAQPGALVGVLAATGVGLVGVVRRYQLRRVPAFTRRAPAGSSLLRPAREPSTIDAPARVGP